MPESNKLWLEIKEMFKTSKINITILDDTKSENTKICKLLKISSASALGAIILNTSGIIFDDWIRLYGNDTYDRKGIAKINLLSEKGIPEKIKRMLIVASDIVGGVFAINSGKFNEGMGHVWYFAPDTLDWEDLGLGYSEFVAWLAKGNIDEFYHSMRWNNWREYSKNIEFDKGVLLYPFLWSKEMDIESASKSIVPFEELFGINLAYRKKFNFGDQ